MVDRAELRQAALGAAVQLSVAGGTPVVPEVLDDAERLFVWLVARESASLQVSIVLAREGKTYATYDFTVTNGPSKESFMTAITMDDTATITVTPEDDHGDATPDQLTWTDSSGGVTVHLAPSADTHTCVVTPVAETVAGSPVVVTCADPSSPALAPFTASFDIGPGATSQLAGTVTVNTGANAAPPAPAP